MEIEKEKKNVSAYNGVVPICHLGHGSHLGLIRQDQATVATELYKFDRFAPVPLTLSPWKSWRNKYLAAMLLERN